MLRTLQSGIICFLCLCMLYACAPKSDEPAPEQTPDAAPQAQATSAYASRTVNSTSATPVGFIVPEGEDIKLCTLKHGFLRTAETLGYPCKLYYAEEGTQSVSVVEEAAQDGCRGLLIWNPNGVNNGAIDRASELSIPVVVPYHDATLSNAKSNAVADVNGYMEEIALSVAERMVERECKSGKILVYGSDISAALAGFEQAIAEYYPQYVVAGFSRRAYDSSSAIDELSEYILWNRDVKGLFCTDTDGALIAVRAREQAQRRFRSEGAPEAKEGAVAPAGVVSPFATPAPEGLTKSIVISVAGYGFSEDNVGLMRTNDIYAFVVEPYYEAGAQSLMLLDRILGGESVPETFRLNMPIVRMSALDKYVLVDDQVREWFGLIKSGEE